MGDNLSRSQRNTIFFLSGITFVLSMFWFAKDNLHLENYFPCLNTIAWYSGFNVEPLVTFFASSIPVVTLYWPFKPRYKSKRKSGCLVIPMYNTKYIEIGTDDYKFITSLSHASMTSQHIYARHPSVKGTAIINNASKFEDVKDATSYDVNDEIKTANLDDIIVLRNNHGRFALIKIVDIRESKTAVKGIEVEVEYTINSTGGINFS